MQQNDVSAQDEIRRKRQEYNEALKKQIEEQSKQKIKDIAMSDYERKVNANYIKAYEEMNINLDPAAIGVKPLKNFEYRKNRSGANSSLIENAYYGSAIKYSAEVSKRNGRVGSGYRASSKLAEVAVKNIMDPTYQVGKNYIRDNSEIMQYGKRYSMAPTVNVLNTDIQPDNIGLSSYRKNHLNVRATDISQMKPAGILAKDRSNYNIISGTNS